MWQPVLMIDGFILSVLGLSMLFPAALDVYDTQTDWSPFVTTALITLFIGVSLFLSNRIKINRITLRQGYLVTTACWISVAVFAALPFMMFSVVPDWPSAFFESVSAVTGTGATVIGDVESLPRSVLLWRSMLNGLGGIGIVIFAVALLPFLGIGGMQIFQQENADAGDKFMPHFMDIAKWIICVYLSMVLICAVLLYLCGMGRFDAVNFSLSAVSTSGFATKNNSVAYFNSNRIEFVLAVFMLLGSLPVTFYIRLLRNRELDSYRFGQVKYFLKTIILLSLFTALWLSLTNDVNFFHALRLCAFNIISVITTTGFGSAEFLDWGIWATVFFTLLSLHGGCIGSTSGSIKVMRWQVLSSYLKKVMISAIEPNRVIPVRVGNVPVSDKVISSVLVYILLFFMSAAVCSIILNFMGYDFMTSISAAIASITNTGPGIVKEIGPMGNYALFSSGAKYLLSFAMLLGRLEIITILVVLTHTFWKN